MSKENNNTRKMVRKGITIAMTSIVGLTGAWVLFHEPREGNHNWRSTHTRSGKPKLCFDTAYKANLQSLKQLFLYGEHCVAYREPQGYYTGHRSKKSA